VNLLHWATITGRPSVIPLLAKAGVPLNDKDKAGFTPLMYAATIDFGTSAVLNALVTAGADPFIVSPDGRNAFEQAERFQHSKVKANAKR
jgi:ankyrin repeat protein